jgi:hypothetical protein
LLEHVAYNEYIQLVRMVGDSFGQFRWFLVPTQNTSDELLGFFLRDMGGYVEVGEVILHTRDGSGDVRGHMKGFSGQKCLLLCFLLVITGEHG